MCKEDGPLRYVYVVVKGGLGESSEQAVSRYYTVGLKEVLEGGERWK